MLDKRNRAPALIRSIWAPQRASILETQRGRPSMARRSHRVDAIGTKTCQIMQRGRSNDILTANEHYIAVEPDFSDVDEAVRRFKDEGERQCIIDTAYDYVMSAHTYAHRAEAVLRELETV